MNGVSSFSSDKEKVGFQAGLKVLGWAMKDHKQIRYDGQSTAKTPMQVLHKLLPALQISGYKSAQTAIFEDGCQAIIDYKSTKIPSLWARAFNRQTQDIQLTISVSKCSNDNCSFDIYSELVSVQK